MTLLLRVLRAWLLPAGVLLAALHAALPATGTAAEKPSPALDWVWAETRIGLPAAITGRLPVFGRVRDRAVAAYLERGEKGAQGKKGADAGTDVKLPVVVVLHGCTGIGAEAESYRFTLPFQGFAVFIPDSFARPGRRPNCNPYRRTTNLTPGVEKLRLEEVADILRRLAAIPWVDSRRLYLIGFSEGGVAAAQYAGRAFRRIVITAWHCHGRDGARGIAIPPDIPLLTIIGENDPWYRSRPGRDCSAFFAGRRQARALRLPGSTHAVLTSVSGADAETARRAIGEFLREDND